MACSCETSRGLYKWENDEIRLIADAAICYGGHTARNPYLWTEERFEKTVAYVDENGQEHWLFDNMIMNKDFSLCADDIKFMSETFVAPNVFPELFEAFLYAAYEDFKKNHIKPKNLMIVIPDEK